MPGPPAPPAPPPVPAVPAVPTPPAVPKADHSVVHTVIRAKGTAPALPWKLVLSTPCRMRPVPSVAMNPFTFSTVTMSPFASPMPAQTISVSATAHGMLAALPAIVVAARRLARLMT